jgi:Domain of unknown function (DUF6460)
MSHSIGRFVGGPPVMVAVRLIVVSLVVGVVLETFGLDPPTLVRDAISSGRSIFELGFADVHRVGRILATGAMVVVPVWLALRLIDSRGRRQE